MLNMCYDVPVKLYSFHLLMMSLFLVGSDLRRLSKFFLFNEGGEPAAVSSLFQRKRLNYFASALQIALGSFLVGDHLYRNYQTFKTEATKSESPLFGIWSVDEFTGDESLLKKGPWQYVIFQTPDYMAIQNRDGNLEYFTLALDREKKSFTFSADVDLKGELFFVEEFPGRETILDGYFEGNKIRVKLKRKDEFTLLDRGFHWITEFPYNR
jgi:hypothetical protein